MVASGSHTHITLSNGVKMPTVGLGTWQSTPEQVKTAVKTAVEAGYRLIDTAWAYRNEKEIGEALQELFKAGTVKREDLFITTKLHGYHHETEEVAWAIRDSLKSLQLDYVDLYLVHSPATYIKMEGTIFPVVDGKIQAKHLDHLITWKGMEKAYKEGLAKSIGLSNFNSVQIQNILDKAEIKPMNLQVECHAFWPQFELENFCKKNGISFTAYAPIGSPGAQGFSIEKYGKDGNEKLGDNNEKKSDITGGTNKILMLDPAVTAVAEKHKKTPAQVLIRWLVQRDISAIPKSVTPARIQQNFNVWDFSLTDAEMKTLNGLKSDRMFKMPIGAHLEDYPFHIPF